MSFTPQVKLSACNVGAVGHSAPSVVQYQNTLYVFYNGVGNDGIYWTTLRDQDTDWANVKNVKTNGASGMGVDQDTGPAAVVYRDKIYLFYNGAGHDGTFYTTTQGSNWTSVVSLNNKIGGGFLPGTSPTAVVFNDVLYVFWNGVGDNGIYYATFDGNNWKGQFHIDGYGIGIRSQTSPAAAVLNSKLYVFYNGGGLDGTWYTIYDGNSWTQSSSVSERIGQNYLDTTSPAVSTEGRGDRMVLSWVGSGNDGLFYTKFDGTNWASVTSMQKDIGAQGLFEGSSPGAVATGVGGFETKVFWLGLERGIFFSSSLSINADTTNTTKALEALDAGKSFVLYSQDPKTVSYFQNLLKTDPETVPPGEQQPATGFDVTGFYNWLFPRSLTATEGTMALATFSVVLAASFLRNPPGPSIIPQPVGVWKPNVVAFWIEAPQQPAQ